jgi:hypothetical protein
MLIFFFGVSCFSPVGSGVDVSNEFKIKIVDNIEDLYFGYQQTRQAAPL